MYVLYVIIYVLYYTYCIIHYMCIYIVLNLIYNGSTLQIYCFDNVQKKVY